MLCLLIASSSISWTVYAATHPSFTTTIETGSMIDRASYVIFKDGSTIFAKNGTTGAIDYSGTNASEIINNVISQVINIGGTILLKAGTYTLSNKIYIPASTKGSTTKTVNLIGETWSGTPIYIRDIDGIPFASTILEPSSDYHGSLIQLAQSTDSNYKGVSVKIENLVLSGIPISSPKASRQGSENITMTDGEAGIKGWNIEQSIFRNLAIFNCYYGIYTSTGSASTSDNVIYENLWFGYNRFHFILDGQQYAITVRHVSGYLSYGTGFVFSVIDGLFTDIGSNADSYELDSYPNSTFHIYAKGTARFENIVIQNSKDGVWSGKRGILIEVAGHGALLTFHNIVIQGVGGEAIQIIDTNYVNSTIRFTNIYGSAYYGQYAGGEGRNYGYGIKCHENNSYIYVEDCDFSANVFQPSINSTDYANFTIRNVKGFVTENSGTATISSSTNTVFNHGLASTPTFVSASFDVTGWTSWKWSATSTQITITVETSGTYGVYWYAEYKP